MFNIFRPTLFIFRDINFSIDTIKQDRFVRERGFRKLTELEAGREIDERSSTHDDADHNHNDNEDNQESNCLTTISRWPLKLVRALCWTLEYNQLRGWDFMAFFLNVTVLSIRTCMNFVHLSRDTIARDQETGEYLDPTLRFMESIYLIDQLDKTDQSGLLHQLSCLILVSLILQRFSALAHRIRGANLNRDKYAKLNVIQLNFSYYLALRSSLAGCWRIFCYGAMHECRRKFALRDGRATRFGQMHRKLNGLNKIDKLYYFNQLNFNDCYRSLNRDLKLEPDARFFLARPSHRSDPTSLSLLLFVYFGGSLFIVLATILNTSALIWPDLEACGCDPSRPFETKWFRRCFADTRFVAVLLQMVIVNVLIGLNCTDLFNLIQSSMTEVSRSSMVRGMLDVEVKIHRSYLRLFIRYLTENNLAILADTRHARPTRYDNCPLEDLKYWIDIQPTAISQRKPLDSNLSSCRSTISRTRAKTKSTITYKDYRCLIHDFRSANFIDQSELEQFNHNIEYVTNLIGLLQSEQTDLKSHFTWNLNLSILSGTLGLSLAFTLLVQSKSIPYMIVCINFSITLLVTLAISLFMGAASERGFKLLHKTMEPLMANELGLISMPVVSELQKVYHHLSAIEHRSFMLLGNIPLTFGSLTSITGWIATCNLLLHRFIQ